MKVIVSLLVIIAISAIGMVGAGLIELVLHGLELWPVALILVGGGWLLVWAGRNIHSDAPAALGLLACASGVALATDAGWAVATVLFFWTCWSVTTLAWWCTTWE